MQIIAGSLKGRKLSFADPKIRPTSSKVKEALFSMIHQDIVDSTFLDIFSGTGAVGLEAYSRGANLVYLVDRDTKLIKQNLAELKMPEGISTLQKPYQQALIWLSKQQLSFDYIFADPPYSFTEFTKLLEFVEKGLLLKEGGSFILEHERRIFLPNFWGKLTLNNQKIYGDTTLSWYKNVITRCY